MQEYCSHTFLFWMKSVCTLLYFNSLPTLLYASVLSFGVLFFFIFHPMAVYSVLLILQIWTAPRQQITNASVDTNTFPVKNKAVRPLLTSNKLAFQDNKRSLINSASVLFGRQFKIFEMEFKSPSLFFLHEILPSAWYFLWLIYTKQQSVRNRVASKRKDIR